MSMGNLERCEPNLIPMLDLVLQLVMFFMLVANFIADDLNESIKLPHAIQAKTLDKSIDHVITLNVDEKGRVLLFKCQEKEVEEFAAKYPHLVLTTAQSVQNHLKPKFDADKVRMEKETKAGKKEPRPSLVVLRAHEKTTYKKINVILQGCRMAGYTDVQLRAIIGP